MKRIRTKNAVDLYCGAGGTSTGLLAAASELGVRIKLLAINHWNIAIDTHTSNHPDVEHLCENIDNIKPREAVPSGHLNMLIASPECIYHSNARGGKPVNDQSRSSAWRIHEWCSAIRIDDVLIENVPEFRNWGPVIRKRVFEKDETGQYVGKYVYVPDPKRKGEIYQSFLAALRALGYRVEDKVINAANHGDATTRERLFIRARRGKKPIMWPEPTHSPAPKKTLFGPTQERWRAARECIDSSIPSQSIFTRKRPLAPNTLARIFAGLKRFGGIEFILPQHQGGRPRTMDEPLPTITGNGNGICQPFLIVLRNHADAQSLDRPVPTIAANGQHMGLCEPFLVRFNGNHSGRTDGERRVQSLDRPMSTLDTSNRLALCEPFIVHSGGPEGDSRSVDEPLRTLLSREHQALVEPFIIGAGGPTGSGRQPRSVDDPMRTIMTEDHQGLVEPFLMQIDQTSGAGVLRSMDEPIGTIVTKNNQAICEPFLVPFFGERDGQVPRTHSVNEPLPAVTSHGAGALCEPFIVPVNHGDSPNRHHSLDDPMPTVTTVDAWALVDSFLVKYYGTAGARSIDEPLDTITTKDRYALIQSYLNDRGIKADGIALLDIRFRMLQPHELAAAMSFPKSYVFTGNREQKVKQIGNAVAVRTAKALCASMLVQ